MASMIIRNLADEVKYRLKLQAAANLRSMEDEARHILREALRGTDPDADLGQHIHARFAHLGLAALPLAVRT